MQLERHHEPRPQRGRDRFLLHIRNARASRPNAQRCGKHVQAIGGTTSFDEHGPIVAIAHEATHAEPSRPLSYEPSEAHTLDSPLYGKAARFITLAHLPSCDASD